MVTGYSLFQLIYGHNVRGPLEVLIDGWVDGEVTEYNLIEWVKNMKINLMDLRVTLPL